MDLQEADRLAWQHTQLAEPMNDLCEAMALFSRRGMQLSQHLARAPISGLKDSFWAEARDRCTNMLKFLADLEAEIPAVRAALEAVTSEEKAK